MQLRTKIMAKKIRRKQILGVLESCDAVLQNIADTIAQRNL